MGIQTQGRTPRHSNVRAGAGVLAVAAAMVLAAAVPASADEGGLSLAPNPVQAGGTVKVSTGFPICGATETAQSEGFVAPIHLSKEAGIEGGWSGVATAVTRPGRYPVHYLCSYNGKTLTGTLEILPGRTTTKPPVTSKPSKPAKPSKPHQVKVLPKGAPQTGGGAMADAGGWS